ncbi:MAG: leucine-rich repeat domain-containing protein [Vicingaceae bacterium]|nr:leucine-rich repeat domain-containing protein [Vicingaceae bacterium]
MMKKLLLPILFVIPALFFAQNIKKEKVKSSFLSYPKIDMNGVDVNTLKAEFCADKIKIVNQSVKKGSNACKAGSGKAQVIEIFYYQVGTMDPASYLRISDNSGNIKYIERTTNMAKGSIEFGKKKCYWTESVLKSAFAKDKGSFLKKSQKEAEKNALKKAKTFLNSALTFTYVPQEIAVLYPKDKSGLYADLTKAAETAGVAYKGLKGNASDAGSQSKLKEAIVIWEKALTESTPELKDSRINKKVTMIIGENLGRAYMYLMDFEKAGNAVKAALDLQKNVSNNGTIRREALLTEIIDYKKGYELNQKLKVNTTPVKVAITTKPQSEIEQFKADYKKHGRAEAIADIKASNEAYKAGVASGEINKYAKYLMVMTGGKQLTLPDLASKMTGGEDGEKLDVFPEELTTLEGLTHLILRGNNLKTIPASIGKMVQLKKLVLTNNKLTSLPDEMGNLKELKNLVIKGNNIPASEVSKIQSLLPNCKIKQ